MPSDDSETRTERDLRDIKNEMLGLLTTLEELAADLEARREIYDYQREEASEKVEKLQDLALELEDSADG
jgi:hypothetical protein